MKSKIQILFVFILILLLASCDQYVDDNKYENTQLHFDTIVKPILAYQDNEVDFRITIENLGLRNSQEPFHLDWITNKGKMKYDTSLIKDFQEEIFTTNTLIVTGIAQEYEVQVCVNRDEYTQCWEYLGDLHTITSWPKTIEIVPDSTTFDLSKKEFNINVHYTIENIKISDNLILIPSTKVTRDGFEINNIGVITPFEQELDSPTVTFNYKVNDDTTAIQAGDQLEIHFELIDSDGKKYPNEIKALIINLKN